jgi:hypothetical protein
VTFSFTLDTGMVVGDGFDTTVMTERASLPLCVFAVIVVYPELIALTTPADETVATAVLVLDQVTVLFVASLGFTVAFKVKLSPGCMLRLVGLTLIPVGLIIFGCVGLTGVLGDGAEDLITTFTLALVELFALAIIKTVPIFFAVTVPLESTVATDVLLLDHVIESVLRLGTV